MVRQVRNRECGAQSNVTSQTILGKVANLQLVASLRMPSPCKNIHHLLRPLGRNKASAPMQQSQGETEKSLNRLNSTNLLIVQQTKQLFVFTIKKGIPQANETLLQEDGNTREGFTFSGLRWKNASRELSTLLLRNVCTALNRNALATPTRPLAGHASRRRQILFEFRVHTRH